MNRATVKKPRVGAPTKDPKLVKQPVSFKLAPDVIKFLREHPEPQSVLIERAIRAYYGI